MFVTFEGLDGSGKSTQAELLRARLEADGESVVVTREPGGTELGEQIRDLVLHGGHVAPWAEALLYAASRAQHVDEVIRPALDGGASVICDRYVDSSVAYQGVARGLGLERVLELNLVAVGGLLPDRTFLLQLDPARGAGACRRRARPARARGRRVPHPGRRRATGSSRSASRSASSSSTRRGRRTSWRRRCMEHFAEIAEQPEAKRLLEGALADGPAHAYLLHGPPGVGKRTAAYAFAAALLGDERRVATRTHPDLYVLEPLGEMIRIDDVRALRHDLHMRPFEADRRVYLVLDADRMNEDAADALLKDLEEPPPYAVIVLVASELGPLPPTILSRCQLVPFRRLSGAGRARVDRRASAGASGGRDPRARARRVGSTRPRSAPARPGGREPSRGAHRDRAGGVSRPGLRARRTRPRPSSGSRRSGRRRRRSASARRSTALGLPEREADQRIRRAGPGSGARRAARVARRARGLVPRPHGRRRGRRVGRGARRPARGAARRRRARARRRPRPRRRRRCGSSGAGSRSSTSTRRSRSRRSSCAFSARFSRRSRVRGRLEDPRAALAAHTRTVSASSLRAMQTQTIGRPSRLARARLLYPSSRADVAQLVEHFTRNEGVRGSSPRVGSLEGLQIAGLRRITTSTRRTSANEVQTSRPTGESRAPRPRLPPAPCLYPPARAPR